MSERINSAAIANRVANVNRRIESTGRHLKAQRRNGYVGLDEYQGEACIRTVTVGTKREIADFLHAMMVGIDLSRSEQYGATL